MVGADASYVKLFTTKVLMLGLGQTTDINPARSVGSAVIYNQDNPITRKKRQRLKREREMGRKNTIFMALIVALITNKAMAEQHVVGGSQGWDESTDFNSWVSGQTFKVGDQLVFKYSSGLHSVVELGSESDYKNCDLGSAVKTMNSGNDVVKLSKPGTRYFACGTLGHCSQGMKVQISTVSGNGPSSPASSSSSISASQSLITIVFIFSLLIASLFPQF